jgi:hypothetical protein
MTMTFAFLPEIAAAAVALFAVRAGDKLRVPFFKRKPCADAERKAVVWSYNPTNNSNGLDAWRPVTRTGNCA